MQNELKPTNKNKVLRKLTEFVTMRFQLKDTPFYDYARKLKPSEPPKTDRSHAAKSNVSPRKKGQSPTKIRVSRV